MVPIFFFSEILPTGTNLTHDEFLSIYIYTLEKPIRWYEFLNSALVSSDRNVTLKWKYYLYYLFSALRKIPPKPMQQPVYRIVNCNLLHLFPNKYKIGNILTWYSFTSTSVNISTLSTFLTQGLEKTVFIITDTFSGRDIQHYSSHPGEEEILLPPTSRFEIIGITTINGVNLISLKQIKSLEVELRLED